MRVKCFCGEFYSAEEGNWCIPEHMHKGEICLGSYIVVKGDFINLGLVGEALEKASEVKIPDNDVETAFEITDSIKESVGVNTSQDFFTKVTADTFEKEVIEHKGPVVVNFWKKSCIPCAYTNRTITSVWTQFRTRIKFCIVDVDAELGIARKYDVRSVPTLLFFHSGAIYEEREFGLSHSGRLIGEFTRQRLQEYLSGIAKA